MFVRRRKIRVRKAEKEPRKPGKPWYYPYDSPKDWGRARKKFAPDWSDEKDYITITSPGEEAGG